MRNRIIAIWSFTAFGIFLLCRFALNDLVYVNDHGQYRPLFRIAFSWLMLVVLLAGGIAATKYTINRETLPIEDGLLSDPRTRRLWRNAKILLIAGVGCIISCQLIRARYFPPAKCAALDVAMEAIQQFEVEHGHYPTNLAVIAEVQGLQKQWTVYFGAKSKEGINWTADQVSAHDLTLLVDQTNMLCFAPVERIKSYSFSSFEVWRLTTEEPRWQRGRIHWSLAGAYWDKH